MANYNNNSNLYNVDLELSFLAGLMKYPDVYVETEFLHPKDFSESYGRIFGVIKNILDNGGKISPVVVAEKCKNISITLEGVDIFTFCESLELRNVNQKSIIGVAKEIKKKAAVRKICENADKLKKEVIESQNDPIRDIIGLADKYLGESLVSLDDDTPEPINFLEELPNVIEELGNDDGKTDQIIIPYQSLRENCGNLRNGNLYILTARAGASKSTFLLDLMRQVPFANPDKPELATLYCDTEMLPQDSMVRYVAGSIGVPFHLIDSKQWRKDSYWFPKIRAELARIKALKSKRAFFEQIGNKSGIELEKYIKRFYLNKVGRGNPFLILYDYLKISEGDRKNSGGQSEYIIAYEKSQILKELAEYCECPVFTAIQANRAGITDGRRSSDIEDNSAVNSMSDRLNWLAAFMGILRKRTHDEMLDDSTESQKAPSHKLIPTKMRYLGENGPRFLDYVRIKEGNTVKFKQNFINLDIDNFAVKDCGTYSQWLESMGRLAIKQKNSGKEGELF